MSNRTCIMCGDPDSEHNTPEGCVCAACYHNGNYLELVEDSESPMEFFAAELHFG